MYDFYSYCARGVTYGRTFVADFIRPREGDRVLDIGCGTGVMLKYLPRVEYVGFDMSPQYIAACRARYGSRGTFFCERVTRDVLRGHQPFDIVLAVGILHHLDDAEATDLFALAHSALRPNGRLLTLDGCYAEGQSAAARFLLRHDRGTHVRTEPACRALAQAVFPHVATHILHDMFRVPYTVLIMECAAQPPAAGRA